MTACIRLLDQMPRSIEMELNLIGQCMISGNSGPREHAPMSAVRSNSENIYSLRVLPPVTRTGHSACASGSAAMDGEPPFNPATRVSSPIFARARLSCRDPSCRAGDFPRPIRKPQSQQLADLTHRQSLGWHPGPPRFSKGSEPTFG